MRLRQLAAADGRREAQLMLRHPNHSGFQMDQITHYYTPAMFIRELTVRQGDDLLLAVGGIEDHPLDRSGGSFGFIDSFLFVYRVERGAKAAERLQAVNVGELGVVTPKALRIEAHEVLGHGIELVAVDQRLRRADGLALCLHCQHAAGVHDLVVERDGAGAAGAAVTDALAARHVEVVTQRVQQRDAWLDRGLHLAAVHL